MADQYILCLIGAMDHLWFNRIVLFSSEPTSLLANKTLKPPQPPTTSSESLTGLSSTSSFSIPEEEEEEKSSSDSSPFTHLDDSNNEEEKNEMDLKQRRPTRLNLISDRARSHSSSPSTQIRRRPRRRLLRHSDSTHSDSMVTLQKSTSFRSFCDLELEEVKGFMDLGFIFKKEDLSPRMMSVVPGLQRVGLYKNKHNPELEFDEASHEIINDDGGDDDENEQEEYEKSIMRPYLSEAWLIKRPDSPLLNLRMPRVSASADMKKHLRFWAKTVASTVNQ
ncbi:hypothetical protein LWI28_000768 [Acer negundo]|uniref:Uncharacterized protein n=1 Tax=Acer negundo TaxID=4023 RepID=A0AAD5I6W7_ACENE|nr:hypothetical protein LWI28_000768 [Acer negundo]KAK4834224.1 hypothetical protein QYF36_019206 [Acer negundo]